MDKNLYEIYSSPYRIEFYMDQSINLLRNTESTFTFGFLGSSYPLNTGDIFLSTINYLPEFEKLEMMSQELGVQIYKIEKEIKEIFSSTKYNPLINMRLLDNENIDFIIKLLNRRNLLEFRKRLLTDVQFFIQQDIEIISGIKEMFDTYMCDTSQIKTSDFPEYYTEFYAFLKNVKVIIEYRKNMEKSYYFDEIDDVLVFDMQEFLCGDYILKKCENCGKYFTPVNRKDEKYCYFFDEKHTCRDVGYQKRLNSDAIQKTYRKIYKTQNARKQRNKNNIQLIDIAFEKWSDYAKNELKRCKDGTISLDEMEKNISSVRWMKEGAPNGNDPQEG